MKIVLSLALSLLFSISFAQGVSSEGREFYLAYIHPPYNDVAYPATAGYFRVYAYISSLEDNTVSVSYFDQASSLEQASNTYHIKARQTTQVTLDLTKMKTKQWCDGVPRFLSCHITSKKPITVQYFSSGANSGGSYLALPVSAWGRDYVVAAYRDNGPGDGAMLGGRGPSALDTAGGVFVVVAAYDSTKVTIVPTARTCDGHVGVKQGLGSSGKPVPYTVTLHRGQCYTVKSSSASNHNGEDDISASTVKSDKPVAVISGHEDAWIDGGDVAGFNLEGRDFMIEQMIPVEYWDHTGYITIPFIDSPSNNGEGVGDLGRIYVSDKAAPVTVHAARNGVEFEKHPGTYLWPEDLNNSEFPVHFWTPDSTKKFSVVQYDIRNHSTQRTTPPFPSPSMMSIVPRSRWKHSYYWYVPTNINERLQGYFVTIIAPKDGVEQYYEPTGTLIKRNWYSDSLRVSVNGSNAFTSVNGVGAQKKKWINIPGHPDLQAITYSVSPGTSYFIKGPVPFMVYHFGCRAVDYDGDLGDFDGDDNFFSYALPLGMTFKHPYARRIGVTIDSLCAGWRVCAQDSNVNGGIRSVTLVSNHKNVAFSHDDDPLHIREIRFDPMGEHVCFDIEIEDPGEDAYAPLYVVDVNGNGKLFELQYSKAEVTLIPSHTEGLTFTNPYVNEGLCKEYLFVNMSTSPRAYKMITAAIPEPSRFTITNISPALGASINPGDTMKVQVCFNAEDTAVYVDSVDITSDCFALHLPLVGQAGTPLILASDAHFDTIIVGGKRCAAVDVRNIGNKPFTMDNKWVLENPGAFTFDTLHANNKFPVTIQPGDYHQFFICYTPQGFRGDSGTMNWSTDIPEPYTKDVKSFSILRGAGKKALLFWDRLFESMIQGSSGDTIRRINLINTTTSAAELTGIWIDGPDAEEFRIVETQSNTNPPTYSGTVIPAGSSKWVDVGFNLDMTKLPITRTRIAYLRTAEKIDPSVVPTVELRGYHVSAGVSESRYKPNISLRPNPARDKIFIDVELESASEMNLKIHDVFGREVAAITFARQSAGVQTYSLDLPKLAAGMYVVTISGQKFTEMRQLIIQ